MYSALNGPEDWILRYIRTCLYLKKLFTNKKINLVNIRKNNRPCDLAAAGAGGSGRHM